MGSSSSRNAEASQRRYLIGTLTKKSCVEQKFFGLSQLIDLKCTSQSKGSTGKGNNYDHNGVKAQDRDHMDLCNTNGATLYKPMPLNKPLYASETFVNWKSHYDIERMQMKLMQRKTAVYLVPIGSFPSFVMDFKLNMSGKVCSLFEILGTFLGIFYQEMTVSWLDSVDPEKENWNITTRNHKVTGKRQYLVSDFYPQLKKWKPKNTYGILGLTWTDLYPTESLNFVLGEASKRHRSGVISFGRFEPKTFDPEKSRDIEEIDPIIMWKLLKVIYKKYIQICTVIISVLLFYFDFTL